MNKIYLPAVIVFLIGLMITIFGSLFKILHWPGASFLLIIGMTSEALAVLLLIIALIRKSK